IVLRAFGPWMEANTPVTRGIARRPEAGRSWPRHSISPRSIDIMSVGVRYDSFGKLRANMTVSRSKLLLGVALLGLGVAQPAMAQNLTIAIGGSVTSIDPHFYNASPNSSVANHIFDRLINS